MADSTLPSQPNRFTALDSWRGIAACAVAVLHLKLAGHLQASTLIDNAWLFVDFFFVLSGFVIAYAYEDRLTDRSAGLEFMIRRFGRVYPLHAAILLFRGGIELAKFAAVYLLGKSAASPPFSGDRDPLAFVSYALLLHGWGIHDQFYWNFPSWSISTEFWTYLLFAVVCIALPRRRAAVSLLLIIASLATVYLFSPVMMDASHHPWAMPRCIAGFFTGVLAQHLFQSRLAHRPSAPSTLSTSSATALELLSLAAAGLVIFFGDTPACFAAPLVFAAMVLIFAQQRGSISRLLTLRPFQWLGNWSYSIYMVHFLLLGLIARLAAKFNVPTDPDALVPLSVKLRADALTALYLLLVIALSALTYRWIETPGRNLFNQLAKSTRKKPPVAPSTSPPAPPDVPVPTLTP